MRLDRNDPPREFVIGARSDITIRDAGRIWLEPDEQVTFLTETGSEYDVARKSWGFYATPSTNGRLADHGLRTALVRNAVGRHYVMLVAVEETAGFDGYCRDEAQQVVAWLDDEDDLERIAAAFADRLA